jgi:hypothetical protein
VVDRGQFIRAGSALDLSALLASKIDLSIPFYYLLASAKSVDVLAVVMGSDEWNYSVVQASSSHHRLKRSGQGRVKKTQQIVSGCSGRK